MLPSEEHAIEMFPMDFEEFLWAMGDEMLMPYIRMRFDKRLPMEAFHRRAMDYFRQYLIVGGMPQAVSKYVETRDFEKVDEVKRDILALYRNDIHKYADNQETVENIVAQMLRAAGHRLYFFSNSSRTSADDRMEIDFLIAKPVTTSRHNISPIEVKSGQRYAMNSLRKCIAKYGSQLSTPYVLHDKGVKTAYLPGSSDGIRQRFCGQASKLHGERGAHPAGNGIERRRQSHIRAKQPLHRRQQPFAYMGAEYAHSGTGDHIAEIMPPVVYPEERHAGGKGIGGCSPVRAVFHSHQLCSGECSSGMAGRERMVVGFDLRSGAAPGCEAVGYGIVETLVREAVYGRSSTEEHCRSDNLHRSEHILMRHALLLSVTAGVHIHRPRTVSVLGVELRGGGGKARHHENGTQNKESCFHPGFLFRQILQN